MADDPSTALLIIDMFSRFDFPGAQELAPAAERAARQIRRLRDHFGERGWPVIYANDNFSDWKRDFRQQVEQCRRDGGPAGRIASLLSPLPGHYFVLKPKHSAFLASPLPILLAKLGVRRQWHDGRFVRSGHRAGCQRQRVRRRVGTGGRGGAAFPEAARTGAAG